MSLFIDIVKKFQDKPTDKVDAVTKQWRIEKCRDCPHLAMGLSCELCGCFVSDKTNYKGEHCPDGRWDAET
jgi:hypothetical protein